MDYSSEIYIYIYKQIKRTVAIRMSESQRKKKKRRRVGIERIRNRRCERVIYDRTILVPFDTFPDIDFLKKYVFSTFLKTV